jgi:hypothetical protein
MWLTMCIYIRGSSVEIQTPAFWNQIGHSMTTLPQVLSPSSILLPPSSNTAHIKKHNYFNFFTFLKLHDLKLGNLKSHKPGSVSAGLLLLYFLSPFIIALLQPATFIYLFIYMYSFIYSFIHSFINCFVLGLITS